jgi:hypothetical protein
MTHRLRYVSVVGLVALVQAASAPAQPVPSLRHDRPTGFSGGGGDRRYSYVSDNVDAVLEVYPFRPVPPGIAGQFRRTLLRELLVDESREQKYGSMPRFDTARVRGADSTVVAAFREDYWGTPRERMRVAIYSSGAVALVEYNASSAFAFQRNWPGVQRLLTSLEVVMGATVANESPRGSGGGGAELAGLYLASVQYFYPNMMGSPGSGSWRLRTQFYLLAENGRVYRGYDLPKAPGGDIQHFDFEEARQSDPRNSGSFGVESGRVVLRMGDPSVPELIAVNRVGNEQLEIHGVRFTRQLRR